MLSIDLIRPSCLLSITYQNFVTLVSNISKVVTLPHLQPLLSHPSSHFGNTLGGYSCSIQLSYGRIENFIVH